MLAVARCLLLALNVQLLSSPGWLEPVLGSSRAYLAATVLLTILNVTTVVFWERLAPGETAAHGFATGAAILAGIAGAILLSAGTAAWLREILIYPHDSYRADMLVVIQLAIRRFLQGGDPYALYKVPWDVPLPYGPVMWAPMIPPILLHADVRFVTLAGMVFTPLACAFAAVAAAARGQRALALGCVTVAGAFMASVDLRHFVPIGHTPVYWPLLGLLAWLVTREQWYGAAVTLGLLIVARTTLVSIAPVLLIAVWFRARPRFAGTLALLTAAAVLPYLPFAIWDARALEYGLYGSYQNVMKTFVWVSTTWVQHTIGTTAILLSHGWERAVEIVQVVVLLALYSGIAVAIRRGRRPLPWMALVLLVFSMTTLWPVIYLYFDVCVLLVCGALAELAVARTPRLTIVWTGLVAASAATVTIAALAALPVNPDIDAGTAADRPFLYSGFSANERDGNVTFAWVNGTRAEMLVPRRSRRDATIVIVCQPNLPTAEAVQQLSASLNGTVIGTVTLAPGWQHVDLPAPARAWQIGVNELTLFLSSAVSPKESGVGEDTRRLSLAVDRLTVRTP